MSLPDKHARNRLRIGFVLAKAFTLSAFAMFVDTLRLASDELDRSGRVHADWDVLGSTRNLVKSSCGVEVAPTARFGDPREFDYIVVIGGLLKTAAPIDAETASFLRAAGAGKVCLIGVCTGSFVLAEIGLMKRHEACVSWLHHQAFKDRFPDHRVVSDRIFNLDGERGTCAGGTSAADMAAFIVDRHIGKRAAQNAFEVLQIERPRQASAVQPRRPLSIECSDRRVRAALVIMEQHVDGDIGMDELASRLAISRRQLERLFFDQLNSSPAATYRRIRLEHARQMVAQTDAPFLNIALDVGFESASQFARAFKQSFGINPSEYRARSLNSL